MSELRDRFRAFDALDVPDVLSRARMIGPMPPDPDPTPTHRRVGALLLAGVVAIVAVVLFARVLDEKARPANTPTPNETGSPGDRAVIGYTGVDPRDNSGDLVAVDPNTGEVRTLVTAAELSPPGGTGPLIGSAAWSADGRWVAFEIVACGGGVTKAGGTGGLWVTNGVDEPRQLTRPCFEDPEVAPYDSVWSWSPTGAELVVVGTSVDGDSLILIDAVTGDRTDLGNTAGDVTSLAWSPDGTRIAYYADKAADRLGGSLHSVAADGHDDSVLGDLPGYVYWAPGGSGGIQWSPDGSRIAIEVWDGNRNDLYVANANGSHLGALAQDIGLLDGEGEPPDISWSPDGTAIAYVASAGPRAQQRLQIWTVSTDGSRPILLFESAPVRDPRRIWHRGPVWSPDGTYVAFEHDRKAGEPAWLVTNSDGSGDVREIDELRYRSWRGGWYFCGCYG